MWSLRHTGRGKETKPDLSPGARPVGLSDHLPRKLSIAEPVP
jgi:hypothetical protein